MSAGKKHERAVNNFPVEGQHNPITKSGLERLEQAHDPIKNPALDYTIGGSIQQETHAAVRSNLASQRAYALNAGYKRFAEVSDKLQTDHVFAAHEGLAKAQFQRAADTEKSYAQKRRETAADVQDRTKVKEQDNERSR